jgi:hypothetical protein
LNGHLVLRSGEDVDEHAAGQPDGRLDGQGRVDLGRLGGAIAAPAVVLAQRLAAGLGVGLEPGRGGARTVSPCAETSRERRFTPDASRERRRSAPA